MSKRFKVGFTTVEECEIRNYAIVKADTVEEAKNILKHIIEEEGENPYASDDERILAVEWEDGKATDVVVSTNGIYSVADDIYDIGETVKEIKEEETVKITMPMYVEFEIPVNQLTSEQVEKLKKVCCEPPACMLRYAGYEADGKLTEEEIIDIYEDVVYPVSRRLVENPNNFKHEVTNEIEEPDETTAIYVG